MITFLWASFFLVINILMIIKVSSSKYKYLTRVSALPMSIIIVLSPYLEQPTISNNIKFELLAYLLLFIGSIIGIFSLLEFIRNGIDIRRLTFPKVKESVLTGRYETYKLITTGLYGIIRHPQIVGFVFLYLGYSLITNSLYTLYWTPLIVIGLYVGSRLEEEALRERFKEEHSMYCENIGMFIPRILTKRNSHVK